MSLRHRLKAAASLISDGLRTKSTHIGPGASNDAPSTMEAILIERQTIKVELEETARSGHVPAEALIRRLHTNFRYQLADEMRQLDARRRDLHAQLRRLNAMFPERPPEPEPQAARRPRQFGPLSQMWGKRPGTETRH